VVSSTATAEVELGTAIVSDNVDADLTAAADNTGPFPIGTTTVTWTATDSDGNSGSDTQVVTVVAADSDGDDVPDYLDAFPNDATESADTDGDGVGDNADAFPLDPDRSEPGEGELFNNLPVNTEENNTVEEKAWAYYRLTGVDAGDQVTVLLDELASDIDLYVRAGDFPNLSVFDCRSYAGGTTAETCIVNVDSESVYIGVYGYKSGDYRLSTTLPEPDRSIDPDSSDRTLLPKGEWQYYVVEGVEAGTEASAILNELSADLDLYVQQGTRPTLDSYDCRSWNGQTTAETCAFTAGDAPTYVGVYAYKAGKYTLSIEGVSDVTDPTQGTLADGDVENGYVSLRGWQYWTIDGEVGEIVDITLSSLSADIDLYVRSEVQPTLETFDCRSYNGGVKTERCTVTLTEETMTIGVYGYREGSFKLSVNMKPSATTLSTGQNVDNSIAQGEWQYFLVDNPNALTLATATLTGLSADIDLYVKQATPPQLADFDCRSYRGSTRDESCTVNLNGESAYIGVYGYRAGDYTLSVMANMDNRAKDVSVVKIDKTTDIKDASDAPVADVFVTPDAESTNDAMAIGGGGTAMFGLWLLPMLWVRRKLA